MASVHRDLGTWLRRGVGLMAWAACAAQAAPTLTAEGIAQGFTLSQFADAFPNNGSVGPLGIAFGPGGTVIVTDYPGTVRVFATNADGQHAGSVPPAQNYGFANAVGLARVGNFLYMTQQGAGTVVRLNLDGTFNSPVVGGIPTATGIFANPVTGKLYVSDCCSGTGLYEVDPVTNTKTQFKVGGSYDGISISADGSTLYAEIGGHIVGYKLSDGSTVFDSGFINGADGTELGAGTLGGKIFVNTNFGEVWEVSLSDPSDKDLLVQFGSRGDFVTADPNGSLLFTQTSDIWRLTPGDGGCIGANCDPTTVPEPAGLAMVGLGLLGLARKSLGARARATLLRSTC